MIIEMIMTALKNVLNLLLVFKIPELPSGVMGYIDTFFDYLVSACGIVANYLPFSYCLTLFGVLLAVDGGIMIYHFVMWIIKKIPMLSMS